MSMPIKTLATAAILLSTTLFTGCGSANSTSSSTVSNSTSSPNSTSSSSPKVTSKNTVTQNYKSGKTVIVGGKSYSGSANLKKYEQAAKAHSTDANAQIDAGISAHVNGNDTLAIQYYKKAIAIDPKSAVAYNDIGNIYFRDQGKPKEALPYYKKATKVEPSYLYGWWNLAMVQAKLGNVTQAKATAEQGLKVVSKSDPNYKYLKQYAATLK